MKIILAILGLAVAMIQSVACAAEEAAWSLEGKALIADSCGVDCHCVIGGLPDNGVCKFVWIGQIDNGQYGGVKLDGVKFAQAGEWGSKDHGRGAQVQLRRLLY